MRRIWNFAALLALLLTVSAGAQQTARGVVFDDENGNGERDAGEPGIQGIKVSNQIQITVTDSQGSWLLPAGDDTVFFVIKPRGWAPPVNGENLPRFYYSHKPNGSPEGARFAGVAPTGPLPASIDFPLHRQPEPDRFTAIIFADTQPRDVREAEYIAHDVIESLIGVDAAFGVTLGDVVFDDLSVFTPLNAAIGLIGIPWYNVVGNHDLNLDAEGDANSDETFELLYGPNYYSFDYGPTHFIVLDDVEYLGNGYRGGIGEQQLAWVKKDLSLIPDDQLVVILMHIPIVNVADRQGLYRLIEDRPYVMSVSGHTHYQAHVFIDESDGWRGIKPHHHMIAVTVSGSWWGGAPNELGIPHTTMRGGAPNGYSVFSFDGHQYSIEFRAAGAPAAYQLNIYAPEEVDLADATNPLIMANVFGGSRKSIVEVRLDDGDWHKMVKVEKADPEYAETYERDKSLERPYRGLPAPMRSRHLWEIPLATLFHGSDNRARAVGTHQIEVRTTDMFGQVYIAQRVIRFR
ncbi:MAG: calcineurin-like phosphoesterase family protein [Armatimonadetes bacterium]|nr:calcineurin-like phosphoesterase family protein [Armatimonadota bacterium]